MCYNVVVLIQLHLIIMQMQLMMMVHALLLVVLISVQITTMRAILLTTVLVCSQDVQTQMQKISLNLQITKMVLVYWSLALVVIVRLILMRMVKSDQLIYLVSL